MIRMSDARVFSLPRLVSVIFLLASALSASAQPEDKATQPPSSAHPGMVCLRNLAHGCARQIRPACGLRVHVHRGPDPDGLNAGLHHLLLFCWRLQQAGISQHRAFSPHPAVSKAIALLGEDKWSGSLVELSRQCGMSTAHFSRLFSSQVSVPLNRYRNSLRLVRFWERLRKPVQPTIMQAVYAAGFGSYAQFYKVFFEAYGQGPRAVISLIRRGQCQR